MRVSPMVADNIAMTPFIAMIIRLRLWLAYLALLFVLQ